MEEKKFSKKIMLRSDVHVRVCMTIKIWTNLVGTLFFREYNVILQS